VIGCSHYTFPECVPLLVSSRSDFDDMTTYYATYSRRPMLKLLTSRVSGNFQFFYQTALQSQFTPLRVRKELN